MQSQLNINQKEMQRSYVKPQASQKTFTVHHMHNKNTGILRNNQSSNELPILNKDLLVEMATAAERATFSKSAIAQRRPAIGSKIQSFKNKEFGRIQRENEAS